MVAALIAEFIGTFVLMFAGGFAIVHNAGLLGVALAHGLAIAIMGSALGHLSGGHFNPAVSVAMLATGRIDVTKAVSYIVAQCLGAATAAAIITFSVTNWQAVKLGTPLLGAGVSPLVGLLLEAITTFLLVSAIFGTAVDKRGLAGSHGALFIGLTVAIDILAIGPITGAAMNPARSFGPALVGSYWADAWVYWVGPILGAVAAAFLWDGVLGTRKD